MLHRIFVSLSRPLTVLSTRLIYIFPSWAIIAVSHQLLAPSTIFLRLLVLILKSPLIVLLSTKKDSPSGKDREKVQDRVTSVLTNSFLLLAVEDNDIQLLKNYDVCMRIEEIRSHLQCFNMYDIFSLVC